VSCAGFFCARDHGFDTTTHERLCQRSAIQERGGVAKNEAEKQPSAWESKADESWFS
jgi:hypothetical protein